MQLPVTVGTEVQMRDTRVVEGIVCRDGTYDDGVAREIRGTYGWMEVAGRRVLDIGGNIGAYARWAIDHGASSVRTIEPEMSNYRCLTENVRLRPDQTGCLVCCSRALVAAEAADSAEIWLSPTGKNPGNTSSVKYRGRVSQGGIPQLAFRDLLQQEVPDVLKIDVEGAEYGFLTEPLPEHVRQCTIELHLTRPEWRSEAAPRIASLFKDWECVRAPRLEGGHWQTIGAWRR